MAYNAWLQAKCHRTQRNGLLDSLLGFNPFPGLPERVAALPDPSARVEGMQNMMVAVPAELALSAALSSSTTSCCPHSYP